MTTTQPTLSLKELAREYAEGRIDRQTFRQRRARLLDELASYSPPVGRAQTIQAEAPRREHKPPPVEKPKRGRYFIALSGIVVLISIIGLMIFMMTGNHQSEVDQASLSRTESTLAPLQKSEITPPAPEIARPIDNDPIKEFVVVNDWSLESRARLLQDWEQLDQSSKDAFSSTSWFQSFSSELRNMIEEERGLTGGEDSEAVNSLIAFATRLGLEFIFVDNVEETLQSSDPAKTPPAPTEESKAVGPTIPPVIETKPSPNDRDKDASDSEVKADKPRDLPQKTESIESNKVVAEKPIAKVVPSASAEKNALVKKTAKATPFEKDKSSAAPATPELENCRPLASSHKIPKCRDQLKNGKRGPLLQLLPGGQFKMGRDDVEFASPSIQVNIGYPFAIGTYEVSYRDFSLFCKETGIPCPPQPWQDVTLPVVNISRDDAKHYAEWLSMQTGRGYRLPTEAEWEYAARAGTITAYPLREIDLHTYAHFSDRDKEQAPLPRRPQRTNPNQFGLFNMAGNVREWVLDSWTDGYQAASRDGSPYQNKKEPNGIVRGGSYADNKDPLRSSARQQLPDKTKDVYTGFRLVRDVYLKGNQEDLSAWGDWWLHFQQDNHLTIQLLTTRDPLQTQRLIDKHPSHALKVVRSKQNPTSYRVLYGLYVSESAAVNAYQHLPKSLKNTGSDLLIKSIRELR